MSARGVDTVSMIAGSWTTFEYILKFNGALGELGFDLMSDRDKSSMVVSFPAID